MSTSHANRGQALEAEIDTWLGRYYAQRRLGGFRTPTAFKVIGRIPPRAVIPLVGRGATRANGAHVVAVPYQAGPPDYVAVAGRHSFTFDAKDCSAPRWPLASVAQHQALHFDRWERRTTGAIAFVLIRHTTPTTGPLDPEPARAYFAVPWRAIAERWHMWAKTRATGKRAAPRSASMSRAELVAAGVRLGVERAGGLYPCAAWLDPVVDAVKTDPRPWFDAYRVGIYDRHGAPLLDRVWELEGLAGRTVRKLEEARALLPLSHPASEALQAALVTARNLVTASKESGS